MDNPEDTIIAKTVQVKDGRVHLRLTDGSTHAFPLHYYPRLARASESELHDVQLRVGGRALRWESVDEDIWIADALMQKYPKKNTTHVAESGNDYRER